MHSSEHCSSFITSSPISHVQIYTETNQESIVQSGGLEALVPLFDSNDKETVTAAVAALRNLSIRRGNEVKYYESKFVTYLVHDTEHCCVALNYCTSEHTGKKLIYFTKILCS